MNPKELTLGHWITGLVIHFSVDKLHS